MILAALLAVPTGSGVIAYFMRRDPARRLLLVMAAVVHALLVVVTWISPPSPLLGGWLRLDQLGQLVLSVTSTLFLAAAFYAVGYLRRESH